MKRQMSNQQFIHKHLLSAKTVLDTYIYWGFNDENEEKFTVMWSLLNMQKMKTIATNL